MIHNHQIDASAWVDSRIGSNVVKTIIKKMGMVNTIVVWGMAYY